MFLALLELKSASSSSYLNKANNNQQARTKSEIKLTALPSKGPPQNNYTAHKRNVTTFLIAHNNSNPPSSMNCFEFYLGFFGAAFEENNNILYKGYFLNCQLVLQLQTHFAL